MRHEHDVTVRRSALDERTKHLARVADSIRHRGRDDQCFVTCRAQSFRDGLPRVGTQKWAWEQHERWLLTRRTHGSDQVEELVEDLRPELQGVDRHALVDAVEERGEVEVGWQPERRETV